MLFLHTIYIKQAILIGRAQVPRFQGIPCKSFQQGEERGRGEEGREVGEGYEHVLYNCRADHTVQIEI